MDKPNIKLKEEDDEIYNLKKEEHELDEEIAHLQRKVSEKKEIMDALHKYNDIKDATQVVLGRLAELYGVTVTELHQKYDLPTED